MILEMPLISILQAFCNFMPFNHMECIANYANAHGLPLTQFGPILFHSVFHMCNSYIFGLLYSRSQGQKNLGPTLSIFGLQIGPKLLINVRKLTSEY
jgi:hypothetical protein